MKYKFVDIGCSFFDTSVDVYGMEVNGLLVEPLEPLFKLLPSSDTVKKVNAAISDHNGTAKIKVTDEIYLATKYLSKEEVKNLAKQQDKFVSSVMNIGGATLSPTHLHTDHLNLQKSEIDCILITFYDLCEQYDITEIDYLNIDTEGHEIVILKQVFDLMEQGKLKINHKLSFEYNGLCDSKVLDDFCKQSEKYGFRYEMVHADWNMDMVLTKNGFDRIDDEKYYIRQDKKRKIEYLYQSILKRDADEEGLKHYLSGTMAIYEIEQILKNSDEYKDLK